MSKASRKENRERLKQERLKEQRRAKRNKLLTVMAVALGVVALIVGGGYFIITSQANSTGNLVAERLSGWDKQLPPQTLQEDGSTVLAVEDASAPLVEVYADYQCSHCADFEEANGELLNMLAAQGKAVLQLRPVSIFAAGGPPAGTNSLRAGAAARAAADYGKFVEYNQLLFANQPNGTAEGYSADELIAWGEELGITDAAFAERVRSEAGVVDAFAEYQQSGDQGDDSFLAGSYVEQILAATNAVKDRYEGPNAFGGTPSVYINGELYTGGIDNPIDLADTIEAASPGEPDTRPQSTDDNSPSPSPTANETTEQ
ncbi:DsbA family protein [Nocardiopsis ansamitocini]|uniref:Thioredoxin-like fold domain-containing protein n=1 Tax=Nocardiopsis ansamitocini TaxID=1670832 RepID=A0A9W6P2J1_9ACTN|nr:thioredoxin domain-containing protein [Nocardiopsis ansamitocini]GLU45921.1 hypothetical protein Nans01_02720 [Nocardiopsis ansamitocini]